MSSSPPFTRMTAHMTLIRHGALLLVLALLWGTSFGFIKVAVADMDPITLVLVRVATATVLLWGFLKIKGQGMLGFSHKGYPMVFFSIGFFGNTLPFFLISQGETVIHSSTAAILMAIMPLMTLLLAHFFIADEPIRPHKIIGIAVGFMGVVLLMGRDSLTGLTTHLLSELCVTGGALCYALATVITRRTSTIHSDNALQCSAAVMLCALVQILPVWMGMLWLDAPMREALVHIPPIAWWSALYLGVLPTGIAAIVYFYLLQRRSSTFFSSVNYLIPCVGVLWGIILLEETPRVSVLIALGVILLGVFIANVTRR